MIPRHHLLLLLLLLAAHVTGCRTARPTPEERPTAGIVPPAAARPDSTAAIPALPARITDAIGLSTPAGRARRQRRKDAAAAVPRSIKVKDGAFSWGGDAIAIGKKAGPSVVKSDSVTQQVATNATAIRGNGNTATQTATLPAPNPGFFTGIRNFFTGLAHWLLWLLLALLVLALVYRKRLPVIGPFFN